MTLFKFGVIGGVIVIGEVAERRRPGLGRAPDGRELRGHGGRRRLWPAATAGIRRSRRDVISYA